MNLPRSLNIMLATAAIAVVAALFFGSQHRAIAASNDISRNSIERVTAKGVFSSDVPPAVYALQYGGRTYLMFQSGRPEGGIAVIEHKAP